MHAHWSSEVVKLVLSLDPDVIEQARELARGNGISISAMFARFVRLSARQHRVVQPLGPVTRRASGIIVLPKGQSDRQLLEDALLKKHEWR